ncbi:MAG: hypothetical protein ACTFAL_05010 [Candidatus Electronema sp. V4]|uniref:hypothetical protein n=1 Tax=Candidatus Electronema sp. V4 TaxID=3454756 RepID=UPI0040557C21
MNTIQQPAENGKEKRASGDLNSREHVEQTLKFLFSPGETFEVCLIGPKVPKSPLWGNEWAGGKKAVIAGWFNDPAQAADIVVQADAAVSPAGIYCTLNPVNPALLGRAENRLKANAPRTADKEITAVRHLLVDADPKRPAGISSTEAEKAAAFALLRRIMAELRILGWDEPLFADSGNGGHLIYRIEPDCGPLVPDLLKFLAHAYSDELVDIDTAVGNPARLTKVYGTMTRKGDSTGERPHRYASILHLPQRAERGAA